MELSETRRCQFADRYPDVRLLDESGNSDFDIIRITGVFINCVPGNGLIGSVSV